RTADLKKPMPSERKRMLVVTYDLHVGADPERVSAFYESLKGLGQWMHYIDSTWLVVTNLSPVDVRVAADPFKQDVWQRLLVIETVPRYAGWLPRNGWDWLDKQFKEMNMPRLPGM